MGGIGEGGWDRRRRVGYREVGGIGEGGWDRRRWVG